MNKIKGGDRMVFRESETVELKEAVTDEIKKESDIEQYDLAISLDCATIKMLNGFAKYFENAI